MADTRGKFADEKDVESMSVNAPVKIPKRSLGSTLNDERAQNRTSIDGLNNANESSLSGSQYPGTSCRELTTSPNKKRRHEEPSIEKQDIIAQKEECRTCRRKIIRNWKILKKYVYPFDLLKQLCKRNLLRRENFEDLNKIDRSLALDKVLISTYRCILTKKTFDIFKAAVNDSNPGAHIEWDTNDDGILPYANIKIPESVISSNSLVKLKLEQIVRGKVAIDIKDDFLIHSFLTIDEHEIISNDLRERPMSPMFIEMIFNKVGMRSFDCLVHSLQQFNEKQKIKQSNIESLVDMFIGTDKQSDLSSKKSSIEIVQCRLNKTTNVSVGFKMTVNLTNDSQQDQSTFNDKVVHNVENLTSDFVRVLGSYPTGADKGSVIIFLKSLGNNLARRLRQSLIDGCFVELLENMFNDKAIKTSLSKGNYVLKVTMEPYKGPVFRDGFECLPERLSLPNIISANRSFLIDQIDVQALLEAFAGTKVETVEKFEKAGIYEAIEISKKAEIFLNVIEEEGLQETFHQILLEKGMTYVLKRFQNYQKVCLADYSNVCRNIIHKFGILVNSIDVDDLKETFVERKVFDISTFDRLEEKFEDNRKQAIAAVLIKILNSGHKAVASLVDVLYINAMDSLADELLAPMKLTAVDIEDTEMDLNDSQGLMVEGIFQVKVQEKENFERQIQEERENFYRHLTVVLDLGKDALAMLLKYELSEDSISFSDFLAESRHDIYHCVYKTCCQCQYYTQKKFKDFALSNQHLEFLLNKNGIKLAEHRHGNFPLLCCSPVKNDLTIDQLDYVLLNFLLASFQLPSDVRKAVDNIKTYRYEFLHKADVARLEYVHYLEYKREIKDAILTVCRYCKTEMEMLGMLEEVVSRPLDMTSLLKQQQNILDAVEKVTDVKIRNQVKENIGGIKFMSELSEECKPKNFYKTIGEEEMSFKVSDHQFKTMMYSTKCFSFHSCLNILP